MIRRQPRRLPLPAALSDRAFTLDQARRYGVDARRLTYDDVVSLGSGVHAPAALVASASPVDRSLLVARALAVEVPETWLSHTTAARIRGLHLPPHLEQDLRVHLSQAPASDTRVERAGVVGHRSTVRDHDVVTFDGLRVSSPARTWLELAASCSIRQLVVLGDQLVRRPRALYEGRAEPFATLDDLSEVLGGTRRVRGRRRATAALDDVRCGADSPPETLLRLALIEAGLPEPALQVPADLGDPLSPPADMAYPEWGIAIQYDGETHYTPEQHRADQHRENVFRAAGWVVLCFHRADLRAGFRGAVAMVRTALRRQGAAV
ncbi:endonuclease domain-containing protein [Nesterenkonia sp. F]|uniref:endonuclease domain-containing protein n=1 Tax=Nesterenkonia sp. F TaxID=795955 RepID=UPI000255D513|nr:hypothetical protein [Nesterenkonia sp. F]